MDILRNEISQLQEEYIGEIAKQFIAILLDKIDDIEEKIEKKANEERTKRLRRE